MIPEPHSSPLQSNGTKRTGLKISFSQPNLRKAGQMNLKFPATGYEATPEKFSIYSKVWMTDVLLLIRFLQLIRTRRSIHCCANGEVCLHFSSMPLLMGGHATAAVQATDFYFCFLS